MTSGERWLQLFLRLGGVLTGAAVVAVFLSSDTMAAIHRALGLGELPAAPITEYLTRSLSAMYALHAVVLFALAADVRRHLTAVTWVGWSTAALGLLFVGIDLSAPMPAWWTAGEGPCVTIAGLVLVYLSRRARAERAGRVMPGIPLKQAHEGQVDG